MTPPGDYLRIDAAAARFLLPCSDGNVTLRPEEISAHSAMYEGLAIRLAGCIALMEPEPADTWEGLARIILDFRQLGFFTSHFPVEEIEGRLVEKFAQLSRGEPVDPAAAEVIVSHAFMARVEALNRGFKSETETLN
jgi:hypothetical protein